MSRMPSRTVHTEFRPGRAHWIVPLLLLIAATAWLRYTGVDMSVASHFFHPATRWPVGGEAPWSWLKHYGTIPAWILSLGALGVLLAGLRLPRVRRFRRDALVLVLAMTIAPGLVVNGILKTHWPRPRPRDVRVLGGDRDFVRVLDTAPPGSGASFPSGHAASAYYPLALYFVLRRHRRRRAARMALAIALAYGTLMGIARIAQGAHFASDIVWSAAIDWFVASALAAWIYRNPGWHP